MTKPPDDGTERRIMTNDEMNIAIAEACGKADQYHLMKQGYYYRPNAGGYTACRSEAWTVSKEVAQKHVYPHDIPVTMVPADAPDYCTDLNAMRDAVEALTEAEKETYDYDLYKVINNNEYLWNATATHRAEAFLKTKGIL